MPTTVQMDAGGRTRLDRTLDALRAARGALAQALALIEDQHPGDQATAALVAHLRHAGGVAFPASATVVQTGLAEPCQPPW